MDYVELELDLEAVTPEVMGKALATIIERGYDIVPIVEGVDVIYVVD